MRIGLALIASALLSLSSCAIRSQVIPDDRIPHRLAQPARLQVWASTPDGRQAPIAVDIPAGWWIASPRIVEP